MKQTINFYDFERAFKDYDRIDNFSNAGLKALFNYLEEYEDSTGEEIELDVIALCCEFSEYESLEDFQANYGTDYESIDDIEDNTIVIMIDNESFITKDF